MAAVSYQYNPSGSDNTEFEYVEDDKGGVQLKEAQVRQYYVTRERQSYSRATEERPNERYASYKYKYGKKETDYIDFASDFKDVGGRQPYYGKSLPSLEDSHWELDELTNSNQDIVENEWKGKINFTLPITNGLYGNTLKFGGKYTSKEKTRTKSYFDYDPDEVLGSDLGFHRPDE